MPVASKILTNRARDSIQWAAVAGDFFEIFAGFGDFVVLMFFISLAFFADIAVFACVFGLTDLMFFIFFGDFVVLRFVFSIIRSFGCMPNYYTPHLRVFVSGYQPRKFIIKPGLFCQFIADVRDRCNPFANHTIEIGIT